MGLFSKKKNKGVENLPSMPELPAYDNNSEQNGLELPPIPEAKNVESTSNKTPDLEIPDPNFDSISDDNKNFPLEIPVPGEQTQATSENGGNVDNTNNLSPDKNSNKEITNLDSLSLDDLEDDLNLDDVGIENQEQIKEDTSRLTESIEINNNDDESNNDKEIPSFEELTNNIQNDNNIKEMNGPLFIKIETFNEIVNITKNAKISLDDLIESNNKFYSTKSIKIGDLFNHLQTSIQQAKKKLYLIDEIIFNR